MTQRDSLFSIKAENKEAALEAIKKLATQEDKMSGGSWRGGAGGGKTEAWFSWVTTSEFAEAKTLKEAISAWRWEVDEDDLGDIIYIYFNGEKLGDDEVLFNAIAPFVEDGSFIEMSGEDGALWRWSFSDGELCEQSAEIIWS